MSTVSSSLLVQRAEAEVGTQCVGQEDCQPGEVCAPGRLEGDPSFCTRSCRADRPCPEGYVCESQGGLSLCNTEITLSELGESCGVGCSSGLVCLDDGLESYCSVYCTLPGSCPEGFRCRPGALSACARSTSLPSVGEPCDEIGGCAEELECLTLPNRTRSYCTYGCEERACPQFMRCEGSGEEAYCTHQPYERTLGEKCVADASDESLIGCQEALLCEPFEAYLICTQDCDVRSPCPEGFGCVYRPEELDPDQEAKGRCLPDVETDPGLIPRTEPTPMMTGGTSSMPPPNSEPTSPSEEVMPTPIKTETSCAQSHQNLFWSWWIIGLGIIMRSKFRKTSLKMPTRSMS